MSLGTNIRQARLREGLTQTKLAQRLHVSQQTVGGWERDEHGIGSQTLDRLAKALNSSVDALYSGHRPNVEPAQELGRMLPLISWGAANRWEEAINMHEPDVPEQWIPSPCAVSKNAFLLRVLGDSMDSPRGESYPAGAIIIVDPQKMPDSGEPAVARLLDTGETTFKVYVRDGQIIYLKPLNPTYLPLQEPFELVGAVLGQITLRR
jgi:SOS-response transcriptional repressor LexA